MLDAFEILSTSGIVLWRRHYSPVSPNIINSLVGDVFIEERQGKVGGKGGVEGESRSYRKDRYTLKWTVAREVGVVFVVGMPAFLLRVLGWEGSRAL